MTINLKKIIAINIATVAVLTGSGFAGYHYYDQSTNYIKTDNAKIDGKQIVITSPVAGKLSNWQGDVGKVFKTNATIGQVAIPSDDQPDKVTSVPVTVPTNVTVVANKGVNNSLVAPGTPLAYGYDFNQLYVTANIDETVVKDIEIGQKVDLYVDSLKDVSLDGEVQEIGLTTANVFSLLPSSNSDANYTKVVQVVPVKISIDDAKGNDILPGMNVSVRVHK